VRVTFLTTMPSPYSLDLFAAMEVDGRIKPRVLYLEMAAPDTYWGRVPLPESAEVLAGGWKNFGGGRVHWNPGAIMAVRRSRPDLVVVSGYSSLTSQIVMRWLRWKRIPWVFWGEVPGMRTLGGVGRLARSLAQRPVFAADAIAAIGSRAVDEYRRLARPGLDVVNIPYHTDLTPFLELPTHPRTDTVRILYCGQLIERKGLRVLIDAFSDIADDFPQLELQLVGEGPLRDALAEQVPARFKNRVIFAGFQSVARLPDFFGNADLFVLPSLHDGWGVVVNQALAAGLPIVCSRSVGAAVDLVAPGQNGDLVPPNDRIALATALRSLAGDADRRIAFGRRSRAAALEWTPTRGVDRWVELAEHVLKRRIPAAAQPLSIDPVDS
jgi:glycosyltransferase involved in cell wall biosynthesis